MIRYWKTVDHQIVAIDHAEDGCWINVVQPTPEEIEYLTNELGLDSGFVKSSLDEEESSRVEVEEDQTLIIADVPVTEKEPSNTILYSTMPIGVIICPKTIVTISLKETLLLSEMEEGGIRNIETNLKTRFFLRLMLRNAAKYLQYLKQIDKISHHMEEQLHKSMRNKELIQLLGLEKSLVYFSTSLKGTEITLEKILRGRVLKLYEEDQDLLEDVLIEIKQAIEMSNIYSSILSGTMDAFASIISNNLNIVMKLLASITIVMSIPTMVFSYYGMNVSGLAIDVWWFPLIISALFTGITAFILYKKKMF